MTKLDQIIAATRERVSLARKRTDLRLIEQMCSSHTPRGFRRRLAAMSKASPAVIAELKKASPSKGVIRSSFPVRQLAEQLARGGASALSVLTDEEFFQGSLANLVEASSASGLPCIRKDFIVDEFQLLEAKAYQADAILLILAALDDAEFRHLLTQARGLGLDVLCEVHNETELQRALEGGADIIGVNSRDLRTFEVNLETVKDLIGDIPSGILRIAESGISHGEEIRELYDFGYQAFLIGETLMRADDPGLKLQQLLEEAGYYPQATTTSADWRGTVQ
ncbi:MAG TPA: indole-3-glycerol phosphate synthase TrpC [Candidatus Angelobacter sp.]|nr:indole-3-glycerol phosphate synthase TrpC [Candidatus Angelobacter sp.]